MLVFQGRRLRVLMAWRERLRDLGIGEDLGWITLSRGELVSRSPSTRCFRIPVGAGDSVYFKRYVYAPRKLMEFWMRPSKAVVEAFGFGRLRDLGIPSLEVLALGEVRSFGVLRAACVVTRGIPRSRTLEQFAREHWYWLPEAERRRVYGEISGRLLEQLRRAHRAGFFHHDLKWRNILIHEDEQGFTPVWIDCPRAFERRLWRNRGVVVDLSCLARLAVGYLSLYDRYRFLRGYLGPDAEPGRVKRLFRQVQAHLERRPPRPLKLPPRGR
jgi:hypothetical protein